MRHNGVMRHNGQRQVTASLGCSLALVPPVVIVVIVVLVALVLLLVVLFELVPLVGIVSTRVRPGEQDHQRYRWTSCHPEVWKGRKKTT